MAKRTDQGRTKDTFSGRLSGWWWFAAPAADAMAMSDATHVGRNDDRLDSGDNPFAGGDETLGVLSPRERLERLEAFSAA